MTTYVRIRCPHCNNLVETQANPTKTKKIGKPFQICNKCNKTYIHNSYRECNHINQHDIQKTKLELIISSLFFSFLPTFILMTVLVMLFNFDFDSNLYIILTVAYTTLNILLYTKANRALKKNIVESLRRLEDVEYVTLLNRTFRSDYTQYKNNNIANL